MAAYTIPTPGDGMTPFVEEKEAAAFLKVSMDALEHASVRLPWLHRRKIGKAVLYDPVEIGFLAECLRRGIVDERAFDRPDRP